MTLAILPRQKEAKPCSLGIRTIQSIIPLYCMSAVICLLACWTCERRQVRLKMLKGKKTNRVSSEMHEFHLHRSIYFPTVSVGLELSFINVRQNVQIHWLLTSNQHCSNKCATTGIHHDVSSNSNLGSKNVNVRRPSETLPQNV